VAKECAREREADGVDSAGFRLCRQWSGVEVEGVSRVGGIAQCAGDESPFADGGIFEALSLLEGTMGERGERADRQRCIAHGLAAFLAGKSDNSLRKYWEKHPDSHRRVVQLCLNGNHVYLGQALLSLRLNWSFQTLSSVG